MVWVGWLARMSSHPDPRDQSGFLTLSLQNKKGAFLLALFMFVVVCKWVVVGHLNMFVTRFEPVHLE